MNQIYLDHRLVFPGDVLVSMGSAFASKVIAAATGGAYSHAALCVAPSLLYEADADGVYSTPLEFSCFADNEGEPRFAALLQGVKAATLLRHDSIQGRLAATGPYEIGDDFANVAALYLARPYSRRARLLSALPAGNALRHLGDWFNVRFARGLPKGHDPGLFCSELIAVVYEGLGVTLFSDKRRSLAVSPVGLVKHSSLKEVPGAVVEGTPMRCSDEQERMAKSAQEAMESRRSQIDRIREHKRLATETEKAIRDLEDSHGGPRR